MTSQVFRKTKTTDKPGTYQSTLIALQKTNCHGWHKHQQGNLRGQLPLALPCSSSQGTNFRAVSKAIIKPPSLMVYPWMAFSKSAFSSVLNSAKSVLVTTPPVRDRSTTVTIAFWPASHRSHRPAAPQSRGECQTMGPVSSSCDDTLVEAI